MDTVDEVSSSPSHDSTPLPMQVGEMAFPRTQPTAADVLDLIAQASGEPWFPSQYATVTKTDRDALDEPLSQLRMAGMIRIATWVRGVGQGYVLTAAGEKAHGTGAGLPAAGRSPETLSSDTYPALTDEPVMSLEERSRAMSEEQYIPLAIDPRPPVVVPALLIANGLWFFISLVAGLRAGCSFWSFLASGNSYVAHRFGSVIGVDLLQGEWWRLLTSCFVHGGGIHLVINLFALAMIGPLAELVWGRWRFAVIYLMSGLAGSSLAMALHPQTALVGASGAIWGILMSLVAWVMLFRSQLPPEVAMDSSRRLGLVILINVLVSFSPGISWQAHLGGAVAGFVTAGVLNAMRSADLNRRRISLALLLGLPVLIIGGLVIDMHRGENWIDYRARYAQEQARRAAEAASKSFDQDVLPLLTQLNPHQDSLELPIVNGPSISRGNVVLLPQVSPLQQEAVFLLLQPPARRNAASAADILNKLAEKKAAADRAIELLSVPPTGVETIDRHRERARDFAEAQSRAFGLLQAMVAANGIPDEAAWSAWGNAKRSAESLWLQLLKR